MDIDAHLSIISDMTESVSRDCRDEWPTDPKSYMKGENLSSGYFGAVRIAECHDPAFGFDGLECRRCVVKTIYLKRRLSAIFPQSDFTNSGYSTTSSSSLRLLFSQTIGTEERLYRFYRKLVMELYVLNRCRHENIMHSHAVYLVDTDLHIVLPRCYVLNKLINMFRNRFQCEPISAKIIAIILRQLCYALDYLFNIGIIHRDVQAENIYLTRAGTVKLGHFGQSTAHFAEDEQTVCKTPVGKKEFMCYEKLHNIYRAQSLRQCIPYTYSSDVWSLGVLALAMISYFPNEKGHKLSEDFALFMQSEKMPFIWLTAEMLQLRARIVKSGGEELKFFLSDYLLTVSAEQRATAATLPDTLPMRKWCSESVDGDKLYLRKHFINEVDFVNRFKLEDSAPNYDCLETKDIPADFYWNNKWIKLERSRFIVKISYPMLTAVNQYEKTSEFCFEFANPEPLFRFLYKEFLNGDLKITDLIPIDNELKKLVYELIDKMDSLPQHCRFLEKRVTLNLRPELNSTSKKCYTFVDVRCENF